MDKSAIKMTCIICPRGCTVEAQLLDGEWQVKWNQCKRGKDYVIREVTCPMRTLTTTVKTTFKDFPRLPVRTDREIALRDVFKYMEVINRIEVETRMKPGDIVEEGLLGREVNLTATADMSINVSGENT